MLYRKLTAMLVVLAVALAELAVVPHGTVEYLLSVPWRIAEYVDWKQEQTEWKRLVERAEQHDPEIMYNVGRKLEHGYGSVADLDKARMWIREAADSGYVPARITVWEIDGGTAQDLYDIIPEVWDKRWSRAVDWREVALSECHSALYSRYHQIAEKDFDRYLTRYRDRDLDRDRLIGATRVRDRWPIAESRFVEACGFSPWPAG